MPSGAARPEAPTRISSAEILRRVRSMWLLEMSAPDPRSSSDTGRAVRSTSRNASRRADQVFSGERPIGPRNRANQASSANSPASANPPRSIDQSPVSKPRSRPSVVNRSVLRRSILPTFSAPPQPEREAEGLVARFGRSLNHSIRGHWLWLLRPGNSRR